MEQQLLGYRLNFDKLNADLTRKAYRWLLSGLALYTLIFVGTLFWYIYALDSKNGSSLVIDECVWWSLNSIEVLFLFFAGMYTVHKMRDMFGDAFSKEAWLVTAITTIFCVC